MSELKFGWISDLNTNAGMARVYFKENDITSNWIPISVSFSKNTKVSSPFDINEQVWCLMDDQLEFGVIGGAIYSETDQPKGGENGKITIAFGDNSTITIDRNSGDLALILDGNCSLKTTGNVNVECNQLTAKASSVDIEAANITLKGNVTVIGNLSASAISTTDGGSASIAGDVTIQGDATIGGKSFAAHKHMVGSSTSTVPI